MSKAVCYVELDIPYCALTYGVAPCQASLTNSPPTGTIKCFNSLGTCQDRANFTDLDEEGDSPRVPTTLRFAVDTNYLPADIWCLPFIVKSEDVEITPATVSLGVDIGQRATVKVKMRDSRYSDTGPGGDRYLSERSYNPFDQGSFFGKFRARHPFLRGRALRIINGTLGQSLEDMETRHFVVESFDGPTREGQYTLIAKDALKLTDGDRAQAPALNNGFLVAAITNVATSATLSPTGIGNLEYPASGHVAIGGNEIASFTRAGDVLTLTRGQLNTVASAHNAQDRVQVCLRYVGQDVADIIYDLLVTYAGIPASWIPLTDWQEETDNFLGTIYTATIAEPTAVDELVSELIEQAALSIWWDDVARLIRLQVLRGIITDVDRFTEDNTLQETLEIREQPGKRISQVYTYFAKINPLLKQDELSNYRSTASLIDEEAEADYGTPAIKKIFSRWIPDLGRTVADRLNEIQIARYRDPPRRFELEVMRENNTTPELGRGYRLQAWPLQIDTGEPDDVPVQITRNEARPEKFKLEFEEMLFAAPATDLSNRQIIIDSNINNVDLRTAHDSIYPDPESGDVVTCTVNAGVTVGSTETNLKAFDVGSWPSGVSITLIVRGRIQGRGGDGGSANHQVFTAGPGLVGGVALYTRYAIDLEVVDGEIFGGGGGGGGAVSGSFLQGFSAGGGGGAGTIQGNGGAAQFFGNSGTADTGGDGALNNGALGGDGGGPGLAGTAGTGTLAAASGGSAGSAIDGISFVTVTSGPGDIRGGQVN